MFRHQELIWFIGCVFYTPCPTCALLMPCSCIAHSHLMHKPLLPLLGLGLYLVFSSLTCHVYFILCSILFLRCFAFCFHFISNSCCTIHASLSLFIFSFISFPHSSWPFCLFMSKRGRVYWRVHQRVYWTHEHSQGEKFHREDAYTRGEKTYFYKKTLFFFFYFMFVFLLSLWCFELLLVSILCCSHHIVFMCWTSIHPYAIVLY